MPGGDDMIFKLKEKHKPHGSKLSLKVWDASESAIRGLRKRIEDLVESESYYRRYKKEKMK